MIKNIKKFYTFILYLFSNKSGASCPLIWGELSSECGASCLGARFWWGELSWGELSLGRVVFGASCPAPNSMWQTFNLHFSHIYCIFEKIWKINVWKSNNIEKHTFYQSYYPKLIKHSL